MEEYTRDSLRELRRNELADKKRQRKHKGSVLITLLIIFLFIGAILFYIFTAKPAWLSGTAIDGWKETIVSAFSPKDTVHIRKTVDSALSKNQ